MKERVDELIHALRQRLVARRVIPIMSVGGWCDTDFNEYEDIGICNTTRHKTQTGTINIYWTDITIPPDKESEITSIIADTFTKIEDTILLIGTKDVDGLQRVAGNCVMEPLDFGTCGNATKAICKSRALLAEDGYAADRKCDIVLNRVQYYELFNIPTAGLPDWYYLKQLLCGGQIYYSPAMPEGEGILTPSLGNNDGSFDAHLNCDFNVIEISHNKWRVWFSVDPIKVSNPNVICRLEFI